MDAEEAMTAYYEDADLRGIDRGSARGTTEADAETDAEPEEEAAGRGRDKNTQSRAASIGKEKGSASKEQHAAGCADDVSGRATIGPRPICCAC